MSDAERVRELFVKRKIGYVCYLEQGGQITWQTILRRLPLRNILPLIAARIVRRNWCTHPSRIAPIAASKFCPVGQGSSPSQLQPV